MYISGNNYTPVGVYAESNGAGGASYAYGLQASVTGATNNYGVYITADKNYFTGNVGIGSLSPSRKLDVRGTTYLLNGNVYMNGYQLTSSTVNIPLLFGISSNFHISRYKNTLNS